MGSSISYTVSGLIEDQIVQVAWNQGRIEGDQSALKELAALALVLDGRPVGPDPEGPFTYQDHLSDALSTLILIEDIFDEILSHEGQLPAGGSEFLAEVTALASQDDIGFFEQDDDDDAGDHSRYYAA